MPFFNYKFIYNAHGTVLLKYENIMTTNIFLYNVNVGNYYYETIVNKYWDYPNFTITIT